MQTDTFARFRFDLSRRATRHSTIGAHMPRVLLLALLSGLLLLPAGAHASTSGVVVSGIYGGGGNAGATFRNDYVELFNGGSRSVDVSGGTVQYANAAGKPPQTKAPSGKRPARPPLPFPRAPQTGAG